MKTYRKSRNSAFLLRMRTATLMAMLGTLLGVVGQSAEAGLYTSEMTEVGTLFYPNEITFDYTETPAPVGDGVLALEYFGDFSSVGYEYIDVYDEDGIILAAGLPKNNHNQYQFPLFADLPLTKSQLSTWALDGTISFTIIPSSEVTNLYDGAQDEYITGTLSYPIPEPTTIALLGLGSLLLRRRR